MWFTSDNAGPAHPRLIEALAAANEGHAMPYGNDDLSARVRDLVREQFEAPRAEVHLVATGTAANSLALACLCPPWATVYCHRNAHIEEDECAAPEFFTGGAKLTLIEGEHAKVEPEGLERAIAFTARAGVHNVQKGALSITQATELGAVYTPQEVARLTGIAKAAGVPVHMDGTRFANALARLGCSPAELSWKAGVDVLCLGATKNGALASEAVVIFEPEALREGIGWEFQLRRKRGGHLFSKMRYVAAQQAAWLEDGLWLELAGRANGAADRLAEGLRATNLATMPHPVDANMMFPTLPRSAHKALQAAGARYYLWPFDQSLDGDPDHPVGCRLVCNWATRDEDVDAFLAALAA